MKYSEVFKEARRLHALGFAVIWLHPKSKRPVESGWTTGPRSKWNYLSETYFDGLNLGVRLGAPSKIGPGFLAVIDVDIKSKLPRHKAEALAAARALLPKGLSDLCPMVRSGRGGGSRHYYCLTAEPFKTWNPAQSEEKVQVHSPSKKPSKHELSVLTASQIEKGVRLSLAWEVSLYSDGRQVVLPPSVHPDSGELYTWAKHITKGSDLPLIKFPNEVMAVKSSKASQQNLVTTNMEGFEFTPEKVDIDWLPIPNEMIERIKNGIDGDRSSYLLRVSNALFSAGLSQNQVLSVLTDTDYTLSACCYEHKKTKDRNLAAQWLYKYTFGKVKAERSSESIFKLPPAKARTLNKEEMLLDEAEYSKGRDWRDGLVKSGQKGEGPPKSIIQNIVLILNKAINEKLVARNTFAYRDTFLIDTPWGAKKDDIVGDDDTPKIKYWLSKKFGFEPKSQTVEESLTVLACGNAYDPVKEALNALPAWDGVKRLDTWLVENFNATGNKAYNAEIFRKWLVAMVMRVYEPGLKFDWMPIFEGPQRAGKSSFGKLLAGGEKHFLDWLPNLHDKDAALALQGMWVVEMGELASLRKNEIDVVKGFVSRTIDKVRPPFGKRMIESPRRCVFFGTTNREQYLQDDTGNRRFKPLLVGRLNFKVLKLERDQLFAEAKYLYDNKIETERTLDQLSPEAAEYEKTIHADKMIRDESSILFEILSDYKNDVEKSKNFNFEKFKIYELFKVTTGQVTPPLMGWKIDKKNEMMAAKALKMMGGEKRPINGRMVWKLPISTKKVMPQVRGITTKFSEREMTF